QIVAHTEVYRDLISQDLGVHLDAERVFLSLCFHMQPNASTFHRLLANAPMASWDSQTAVQSMRAAASPGLRAPRTPVQLTCGARGALVEAEPSIGRAATMNPRIRSKLYADSGHAPFIEEPERFNHDLADFVATTLPR